MSNHLFVASRSSNFNPFIIAVTYKWFAIATVVILATLNVKYTPYLLIALLAVYTMLFSFLVLRRDLGSKGKLLLLAADFAVCISLLFVSGGWASPYFQYGLGFLLLSALLFGFKGAGVSIILYGTFYYIGLYVNGFNLKTIIAKGYLESLITDYAISVLVGLSSAFIVELLDRLNMSSRQPAVEENPTIQQLEVAFPFTSQEEKVANLLLDGLTNKQIALELGISANTVKFHLNNIYRKLGVGDRSKAIVKLSNYSTQAPPEFLGKLHR